MTRKWIAAGLLAGFVLGSGWSGASAQSLTVTGFPFSGVGNDVVFTITGNASGGSADLLAFARLTWDPALATAVSYSPVADGTFTNGGNLLALGSGRANVVNIFTPSLTSTFPSGPVGGQLTLHMIAAGTLNLSFDAPAPMTHPRFFGLAPGAAGTHQVMIPEPSRMHLLAAGMLAVALLPRRRTAEVAR